MITSGSSSFQEPAEVSSWVSGLQWKEWEENENWRKEGGEKATSHG